MSATIASEPLSRLDTAWLRMDSPTNLMQVTSVLIFDEPLDVDRLRDVVVHRLLRFDRFRQRVVMPRTLLGSPRWVEDEHFDVDAHIHRVGLPRPGDTRALQAMVGDIMSMPLDHSKPLWQMHVIDGYGEGSVLLTRLHHCIADGVALMRVLLSLTDSEAEVPRTRRAPGRAAPWPASDGHRRSGLGTALHAAGAVVHEGVVSAQDPTHPFRLARIGADGVAAFLRVSLLGRDPQTALKGDLGTRKRAAWSDPVPLAEIKSIAHLVGGTVNDVVTAAVTGALRKHLTATGVDVERLVIHATVPVDMRPVDGGTSLGNRFGTVFLELPVGVADPLERLDETKRRMDAIKKSPEAAVSLGFLGFMGSIPAVAERVFLDFFTTKSTMVMTNVPGPREVRYLAGSRIRRTVFWAPPSGGLGVSVSIGSYMGAISVAVTADTRLAGDPARVVTGFHDELEALRRAGARVRDVEVASRPVEPSVTPPLRPVRRRAPVR